MFIVMLWDSDMEHLTSCWEAMATFIIKDITSYFDEIEQFQWKYILRKISQDKNKI